MAEQVIDRDDGAGSPPAPAVRRWARLTHSRLRRRLRRHTRCDGIAATATWAIGLLLAVVVVRASDLNPFTLGGAVLPVGLGAVAAAPLLVLIIRRPGSHVIVGVAVGAYAAWVGLTMLTALHGTPHGYAGLGSDEGRLVAQATKYATTWRPVDAYVRGLPTEYPPLFPWLVGRAAWILHRPAWTVIGDGQVIGMSLSLVLGYLLWRRLVHPGAAFLIVALTPLALGGAHQGDASKVYEYATLLVMAPWILATFLGLPRSRGGLHWLPAGIIGGLVVLTYSGYLVFTMFGLVAAIVLVWRGATSRRRYLLHLVAVALTAFVVASWYVVPYAAWSLTHGGNRLSDLFPSASIVIAPITLTFTQPTPLGLIELAGLVGIVWYRKREWWAQPLLLLVVSTYVYRVIYLVSTSYTEHTGFVEHTEAITAALLIAAGIMALTRALGSLATRMAAPDARRRELALLSATVVVAWAAVQLWSELIPAPIGVLDARLNGKARVGVPNFAAEAHAAALANGSVPRIPRPGALPADLPATLVHDKIQSVLGPDARPQMLSRDAQIYSYYPYYAYLPNSRLASNTLERWDDRYAAVRRLAQITDPGRFATASAQMPFGGRIDVFLLEDTRHAWIWQARSVQVGATPVSIEVRFSPGAFGSNAFAVYHLPGRKVLAIRLPHPQ